MRFGGVVRFRHATTEVGSLSYRAPHDEVTMSGISMASMSTYAILGCGSVGHAVAEELVEEGKDVLILDKDEGRVEERAGRGDRDRENSGETRPAILR